MAWLKSIIKFTIITYQADDDKDAIRYCKKPKDLITEFLLFLPGLQCMCSVALQFSSLNC